MSRKLRRAERRAREAELPFWRQSTFIAAATFVGAVVLAGLFLLFTSGERPPAPAQSTAVESPAAQPSPQEPESATTTAPEQPLEAGPAGNDACPQLSDDSGQDALQVAPEVQWSPVGDVATATSATDGPTEQDGPRRCYAQTATGALLAAHNFAAEANSGVSLAELVDQRVATSGPAHQVLAADAAAGRQSSGNAIVLAAYRFIEANPDAYTVALLYQVPQSSSVPIIESRVTVRWMEDDWMVWDVPPPKQISEIPAGFIEWGPLAAEPE